MGRRAEITADRVAAEKMRAELAEARNRAAVAGLMGRSIAQRRKAIKRGPQGGKLYDRGGYRGPGGGWGEGGFGGRGAGGMMAWSGGGYEAAQRTRANSSRSMARGGSADSFLDHWSLDAMRRESRALLRNNKIARSMVRRCVDMVAGGPGFTAHAETEDKAWNKEAERLFSEWAENRAGDGTLPCDIRGMMTLSEMTRAVLRQVISDGDLICIPHSFGQLQFIDGERIVNPQGQANGANLVNGVELNEDGAAMAYWLAERSADGSYVRQGKGQRLPADQAWFLARPEWMSQTRGEPRLASIIDDLYRLDDYVESVEQAAHIATLFGLVTKTADPATAGLNWAGSAVTRSDDLTPAGREIELQPMMVEHLAPGESIEQIKPEQPTTNFGDFVIVRLRLAGLELDLPIELTMLNFGLSNFFSAKAALMIAARSTDTWVTWLTRAFLRKVWTWRIGIFIEQGKLAKREDYAQHRWTPPPRPILDPVAQTDADLKEISAGLSSRKKKCAERGIVYEDNLAELAEEQEQAAALGIAFGPLPGAGPVPGGQAQPAGPKPKRNEVDGTDAADETGVDPGNPEGAPEERAVGARS